MLKVRFSGGSCFLGNNIQVTCQIVMQLHEYLSAVSQI